MRYPTTQKSLLEKVCSGDEVSWTEFFRRYAPVIRFVGGLYRFNDAECETLSHWDRMSDRTFYIFTNPDEALTAKFQTMYEKVIQELSSPGRRDD